VNGSGPTERGRGKGAWTFAHFCLASVLSFALDNACFWAAFPVFESYLAGGSFVRSRAVLFSLVFARLVSGNFNYFYNRRCVFRSHAPAKSYAAYWALALAIAALSYFGTMGFVEWFDLVDRRAVTACKIAVEAVLFVLSFFVQRRGIFARGK